jgi:hypothetical protein
MAIRLLMLISLLSMALLIHGCSFGGDPPPDPEPEGPGLYFPLKEGTNWTYRCVEPNSVGDDSIYTLVKTITNRLFVSLDSATTYEPPFNPAVPWFRQSDSDSSYYQNDGTFIWMGQISDDLASFGYNGFVPLRVLPIHYEDYDSFATVVYKGSGVFRVKIVFAVIVIDSLEDIETEMGTFFDCVRVETFLSDSSLLGMNTTLSTIWFADSIGAVKRHDHTTTGTSNVYYEELIDYSIE